MRYLQIERAFPGMLLGSDVLDSDGRILISKNTVLTEQFIERLINLGIPAVYVEDKLSSGVELKPPISPVLRSAGLTAVRNKDIDSCRLIAQKIVQEILHNGYHSLDMQDLRTFDDYTFAHSVNVAVMSCIIGFGMELSDDTLIDLVFAALLHDLGKLDIPTEILNKPGHLTPEEFALIKTHPIRSYEIIEDRLDISSHVKTAVLCHHENYDGSGYPKGLAEQDISLLARIIHVTDVYDALTSARPYKKPYSPYAATEILEGGKGTTFDPEIVDAFVKYVPIYPKGSEIELSDGTVGLVIENSEEHNMRPIIRRMEDMAEIDLNSSEYRDIIITRPSAQDYFDLLEEEEQRKQMTAPLTRYRIMVVDYIGDSYREISEKLNYLYEFQWAKNETSAEGFIQKYGKPDMLLVDIDGLEMSKDSNRSMLSIHITHEIPVIVLGSYKDVTTITHFRQMGIQNYVLKPFHIIYLQSEIRNKLETLR
ncbi:MAG: HD domain-containing protein [Lachnospiraceae bacterium]|nr:HD domain-containing protein [Lachnospiraceae bacterium]